MPGTRETEMDMKQLCFQQRNADKTPLTVGGKSLKCPTSVISTYNEGRRGVWLILWPVEFRADSWARSHPNCALKDGWEGYRTDKKSARGSSKC